MNGRVPPTSWYPQKSTCSRSGERSRNVFMCWSGRIQPCPCATRISNRQNMHGYGLSEKSARALRGTATSASARARSAAKRAITGSLARDAKARLRCVRTESRRGHALPRAALGHALAGRPAQAPPQHRVGEQPLERRAQAGDVARLDEEAGHAVLDELGDPADRARHDGPPVRHRLEDAERKAFAERRADDDGRLVVEVGEPGVRD